MPSRSELQIGDRIRLLRVPEADLAQRERELRAGSELPGWTADTIEAIIRRDPIVVIDRIDDDANPWFSSELPGFDGTPESHFLAVLDDDSWERVE